VNRDGCVPFRLRGLRPADLPGGRRRRCPPPGWPAEQRLCASALSRRFWRFQARSAGACGRRPTPCEHALGTSQKPCVGSGTEKGPFSRALFWTFVESVSLSSTSSRRCSVGSSYNLAGEASSYLRSELSALPMFLPGLRRGIRDFADFPTARRSRRSPTPREPRRRTRERPLDQRARIP
jgi:hypothetical protein